jgi:hypothetical protein
MSKSCEILIFCMIFVVKTLSAQQNQLKSSTDKAFKNLPSLQFSPIRSQSYSIQPVPGNFYVKNLGFFCRQELKLEAATGIPFKFRLGSVNYCDRMEGKRSAGPAGLGN